MHDATLKSKDFCYISKAVFSTDYITAITYIVYKHSVHMIQRI